MRGYFPKFEKQWYNDQAQIFLVFLVVLYYYIPVKSGWIMISVFLVKNYVMLLKKKMDILGHE